MQCVIIFSSEQGEADLTDMEHNPGYPVGHNL